MAPINLNDPYLVKLMKSFPIEALAPLGLVSLLFNQAEFIFKLGLVLLLLLPVYMLVRNIRSPLQILSACFGFLGWLLIVQKDGANEFLQDTFHSPHPFIGTIAIGVFLIGVFQLFFRESQSRCNGRERVMKGPVGAAVVICFALASPKLLACGSWQREELRDFSSSHLGTIAIQLDPNEFLVLPNGSCVLVAGEQQSDSLHLVVNHRWESDDSARAFLTFHIALAYFRSAGTNVKLYRNDTNKPDGSGSWRKGGSLFDRAFDSQDHLEQGFSTDEKQFDFVFSAPDGRQWDDYIENRDNGGTRQISIWDARANFTRDTNELTSSGISVRYINAAIAFGMRNNDASGLGAPPSYDLDTSGADCAFIRVGSSGNLDNRMDGRYLLDFHGHNDRCEQIFGVQPQQQANILGFFLRMLSR